MSAANASLFPRAVLEQLGAKNRRRAYEAHSVIDACPGLNAQAKELGHLLVTLFATRGYATVYASAEWLAQMLEEHFNRKGYERRAGRGGPGIGKRRLTLCIQSILNRVHAIKGAGLLAVKRRKVPGHTLKFTLELSPTGLLRDALRGAYKAWRHQFDKVTPSEPEPVSTPKIRTLLASLFSAVRANASKKLEQRVPVLPEASMCLTSSDSPSGDDRTAEPTGPPTSKIAAAALEAAPDGDRDAADAIARLRALGILT